MPANTYHIRIKKDYAAAIIEGLQKLDAVELLPGEELPIPEWQKKEVRKRLKDLEKNPRKAISWDDAVKKIRHRIFSPGLK
jgi:Putative addiction module component